MKRAILLAFALALVFSSTLIHAQDKEIPNLVGTWDATASGHAAEHGFHKKMEKASQFVIKDQQERIFHGVVTVNREQHKGQDAFSGIIAKDNKTLYVVRHGGAVEIGTIDGPNDMTLYILIPGGSHPRAVLAELKRVK